MAKKRKPAPQKEESSSEEEEDQETDEQSEEEEDEDLEEQDDDGEEEVEEEEGDEEDEEEDENSKREYVRKLLEPLGKDQLIEILKEVGMKNRSIIDQISHAAESDPVQRNIFVHGLAWDVTNELLLSVFKQYGQIEDCNVVTDKLTGKSKGFGFVLFKTRDGARKALVQPQKKIGSRMAACQLASFGPIRAIHDATGRKVYVANVAPHVNPEKLRAFFSTFGEIEEGPLGYDRVTGRLKGFAIFIYKTAEGCKKALEEPIKLFDGCKLQCQRAVEGFQAQRNQIGEPVMGSAAAASLQPNDLALTYAMGLNPGMVNQNLTPGPAAVLMGQNPGFGALNPAAALGNNFNQAGLSPSIASGLSPSVNRGGTASSLGLGAAYGPQLGINSISPSVIGSYGSQAALQGLGAYQSAHLGQSSATTLGRSQSGIGSMGTFPSHFER